MSAIPATSLAGARSALNTLLADTCTIERSTQSRTGAATVKSAPATIATGVPCRVEVRRLEPEGKPSVAGSDRHVEATHIVQFAYGQDVQQGDTIVHDQGLGTFHVVGLTNRTSQSFTLQVLAKEHV
jgi:hypothetical protein